MAGHAPRPRVVHLLIDPEAFVGYLSRYSTVHYAATGDTDMPTAEKPLAKGLARLRTPIPLFARWRNYWYSARLDQMIEIEHIFGTRGVWKRLAKAHEIDPAEWRVRSFGPFICGYRLRPDLEQVA